MSEPVPIEMSENESLGRGARTTRVSEIMTTPVHTIEPAGTRRQLMQLLLKASISGAPVVDKHDRPIGIATLKDLVRDQDQHGPNLDKPVSEFMTPHVITVTDGASVAYASALMAQEAIHRVPVVSGAGRIVGIVSSSDIVRWLAQHEGYVLS